MSNYYIIPAREGSKGFKNKNRILFESTARTLLEKKNVIVTTDDKEIEISAGLHEFSVLKRSPELSSDTASMKDVLINVRNTLCLDDDDNMILLYLTYPSRTEKQIHSALVFFEISGSASMLCRIEPLTNPFLCIYEDGEQIIKHNLYRRQDYPKVYEISHAIGIFKAGCLEKLNNNLYNNGTHYFGIERMIDVDSADDLRFMRRTHANSACNND